MMRSKFGSRVLWIHRVRASVHDVFVKRIFHELLPIWIIVNTRRIRLVLGEKRFGLPLKGELITPKNIVPRPHEAVALQRD